MADPIVFVDDAPRRRRLLHLPRCPKNFKWKQRGARYRAKTLREDYNLADTNQIS
jgi:hypothetical protein